MGTIYVDKFTALESMYSNLRIRHHGEHMQIQTSIKREDIRSIVRLKPQSETLPAMPEAIAIKTVDEQVVIIPAWSDEDALVMLNALSDFWRNAD